MRPDGRQNYDKVAQQLATDSVLSKVDEMIFHPTNVGVSLSLYLIAVKDASCSGREGRAWGRVSSSMANANRRTVSKLPLSQQGKSMTPLRG